MQDQELEERVASVERLLDQVEALPDPDAKTVAGEAIKGVLALYGEGLARMMERIAKADGGTAQSVAEDELIAHLLLLHGLHPVSVETRVLQALDEVRPYLASHGGDVELLSVTDSRAHLRLEGSCSGCPASSLTLKLAIEQAVQKAAPELEGVDAIDLSQEVATDAGATAIHEPVASDEALTVEWTAVGRMSHLTPSTPLVQDVAGQRVLFLKLEDNCYAYEDACPSCGQSLQRGSVEIADLACPGCGTRYDVRRAGRCLDQPQHYLRPIPLLVSSEGIINIAVPATVS